MPKFAANLSMMFQEVPFLDRFAAAKAAGFAGVEFLFPYDFPKDEVAARLRGAGLTQALFNTVPGEWSKGERGLACLPGREAEFLAGVDKALDYAEALACPTIHCRTGWAPRGVGDERLAETYAANLKQAAPKAAAKGVTVVIEPINTRDIPGF